MTYTLSNHGEEELEITMYRPANVIAQGDLFDDALIIKPQELEKVTSFAYRRTLGVSSDYEYQDMVWEYVDECQETFRNALNDVPYNKDTNTVVFNKLWEQMDLPLDTGKEMLKL